MVELRSLPQYVLIWRSLTGFLHVAGKPKVQLPPARIHEQQSSTSLLIGPSWPLVDCSSIEP